MTILRKIGDLVALALFRLLFLIAVAGVVFVLLFPAFGFSTT